MSCRGSPAVGGIIFHVQSSLPQKIARRGGKPGEARLHFWCRRGGASSRLGFGSKKVRKFWKTNKTLSSSKQATHPQSMKKRTKVPIPASVKQFLAEAVSKAQRAADEAVVRFEAEQQPRPFPFDSVEEWHAFDAVLERWLQRNERPRRSDAA